MTNQIIVTAVIKKLITTKLLIAAASNVQLLLVRFEFKRRSRTDQSTAIALQDVFRHKRKTTK